MHTGVPNDGRQVLTMRIRQRGALSLWWVAIVSALLAAAAMAAIWSMRHERNLFAEGVGKVADQVPVQQAIKAARQAAGGAGALRKCVVAGRTVVSNTDCADANPSSRRIDIVDPHGIDAPRTPPATPPAPGSNPALDKIIEKQLN
jgi:hypothetical protein